MMDDVIFLQKKNIYLIKLIKMKKTYTPLEGSRQQYPSRELSPEKQQWALINQYKALEYQRLKQREKQVAEQKKRTFKRELDNQLSNKNDVHQQEVQADRRYYEFITNKANMQKQKEERQKFQKHITRREIQERNRGLLEMNNNSRLKDYDTGYHLDIGHKSQQERIKNSENIKKQVLDTLDQQLKQKQQEKFQNKLKEMENDYKNMQYQNQYHDHRNGAHRNIGQNQKVYQYYQQLDRQKKMRDYELENKLVEEAAERKRMQDDQRTRNQQLKKAMNKEEVKETLDYQIRFHNLKKMEENRINPQDFSYGVMSNMFRQKPPAYDKNKYIEELRLQAEEQKRKRKMENFMTEDEYKFNVNQLNKIVSGQYAHKNYLDRSMGTIGDNKQLRMSDTKDSIQNKDAEAVRYKLQNIKQRNNSLIISRNDRSF